MWLAIRSRAFSFLLTILKVLLIYSSNFSSESKVIQSSFSVRLDAIDVLSKWISFSVFQLKVNEHQSKIILEILWSSEIADDISCAQE